MTFRSHSLKTLLVWGAACTVRLAHADPSAADITTARQAFESAVALEAEQKWGEATSKLRQALAIKDTPGLRFHLAHCEEQQGLLVEASLDYDRASELLRQGAKAPDVQKLLIPASAALKPRIPHVTIELPSDVPNAVAELDGKPYPPSELALGQALNPGSHRLQVSAPGRSPFQNTFTLKEGEQISIRADLRSADAARPALGAHTAAVAAPASAAPISPEPAHAKPSAKLYLLVGESAITVAGLALGIGYGLAESSARGRVQTAQKQIDGAAQGNPSACSSPGFALGGTCTDLRTAIDDHDRDATLSTVGFVCAGVGAAALLTTWFAFPSGEKAGSRPAIQPTVSFGRVGVQGRF